MAAQLTAAGAPLQDYALVVGINHYEFDDIANLEGAENDAKDFIDWLHSSCSYGQIRNDRIMSRFTAARYSDLHVLVTKLLNHIGDKGKRGRRLYVFLAGHGCAEGLATAYLYSSEHTGRNHACWDIFTDVGRLGLLFQEVILFADCCRSVSVGAEPYRMKFHIESGQQPHLSFYCMACGHNDITGEDLLEDGKVHGIFSHKLLLALHGHETAAVNANGEVTANSLTRYLVRSAKLRPTYLPIAEDSLERIVLARGFTQPSPRTIEVRLRDPSRGYGVFDHRFEPLEVDRITSSDGRIHFFTRETNNIAVTVPDVNDVNEADSMKIIKPNDTAVDI